MCECVRVCVWWVWVGRFVVAASTGFELLSLDLLGGGLGWLRWWFFSFVWSLLLVVLCCIFSGGGNTVTE